MWKQQIQDKIMNHLLACNPLNLKIDLLSMSYMEAQPAVDGNQNHKQDGMFKKLSPIWW